MLSGQFVLIVRFERARRGWLYLSGHILIKFLRDVAPSSFGAQKIVVVSVRIRNSGLFRVDSLTSGLLFVL